jgi:CarD family transcriptional regulator
MFSGEACIEEIIEIGRGFQLEGRVKTVSDQGNTFRVGDDVIHWAYGLGKIIQLDEKVLSGQSGKYYVVQIINLTLWVPMTESGQCCLRYLTPAREFPNLFSILSGPGEPLSLDRNERRMQLTQRLKDGSLESICRVIRDLTFYKQTRKTNESDSSILEHSRKLLLNEWSVALSIPPQQAERELKKLLDGNLALEKPA